MYNRFVREIEFGSFVQVCTIEGVVEGDELFELVPDVNSDAGFLNKVDDGTLSVRIKFGDLGRVDQA